MFVCLFVCLIVSLFFKKNALSLQFRYQLQGYLKLPLNFLRVARGGDTPQVRYFRFLSNLFLVSNAILFSHANGKFSTNSLGVCDCMLGEVCRHRFRTGCRACRQHTRSRGGLTFAFTYRLRTRNCVCCACIMYVRTFISHQYPHSYTLEHVLYILVKTLVCGLCVLIP